MNNVFNFAFVSFRWVPKICRLYCCSHARETGFRTDEPPAPDAPLRLAVAGQPAALSRFHSESVSSPRASCYLSPAALVLALALALALALVLALVLVLGLVFVAVSRAGAGLLLLLFLLSRSRSSATFFSCSTLGRLRTNRSSPCSSLPSMVVRRPSASANAVSRTETHVSNFSSTGSLSLLLVAQRERGCGTRRTVHVVD